VLEQHPEELLRSAKRGGGLRTQAFDLIQPTISHVGKLRDAGLVDVHRVGIWAHYSLRPNLPTDVAALVVAAAGAA
jgi:DNA-binding transcriptional ArsR family regulator